MFEILFGHWRKASKCKKVIKMVQCRLKLLTNRRRCIAKQLREDVAQLLKHGHHHTAFDRAEQLIVDEGMLQVYDLLDQFCQFLIFHLPYIRKHRDCPNDINEAASTLIFSSAKFGEMPELMLLRKLFGERYGQRFVINALQLRPGNLVNYQIKENVYTKEVSDDFKYRLLAEIASSYIQQGPLFLEYKPELQRDEVILTKCIAKHEQANEGINLLSFGEIQRHNYYEAREPQLCIGRETQAEIMPVDSSSEATRTSNESWFELGNDQIRPIAIRLIDRDEMGTESSSESSTKLPEETIYLDDIEEYVSPVSKDGYFQDQRLFVFKSFTDYDNVINLDDQKLAEEKIAPKRSCRKTRKASRKRSRRRSISQENTIVTDIVCATYYGDSKSEPESSPDGNKRNFQNQREPTNKILEREARNSHSPKRTEEQSCLVSLRAMSMPVETPKESFEDNIIRSISFPYEQPRHIHPKLPDYDELAAKFKALKKVNIRNDRQSSNCQQLQKSFCRDVIY